jgi:Bacterial Ig-like domain
VLVATFADTGTPGSAASYSATINWGDGTASTAPTRITSQGTGNGVVFSVFGNHTYADVGTFGTTVTITNTADGAVAIASGQAIIAGAALTPSTTQPTIAQTEAVVFSGPVASFTDGDPSATASDFTDVTIYWGDGTPATAGTISQPAGGTAFVVSGTHTYANAGVDGGIGTYPITVNVHDKDGSTVTITNTANIADVPLIVTGNLNPASDSGISNSDNITNVVQPNFLGTTNQPDATVTLFAQASGGTPVVIGQGVSNANDAWSITANQALATGTYVITAVAVDSAGFTHSATTTIVPNLVIDTVAPVITAATFDRFTDTLTVTYQDNLSGLALASVTNGAFYHLSAQPLSPKVPVPKLLLPTAIDFTPGATATDPFEVSVVFNNGHKVRGGRYLIVIDSGVADTGIHDVAGNALDGNFYGTFPSGDGLPGGDFAASIDTFHNNIVLPPVPFRDGFVPPSAAVDPPAHSKAAKTVKNVVKTKVTVKTVRQPVKTASAHDSAIESLTIETKHKRHRA